MGLLVLSLPLTILLIFTPITESSDNKLFLILLDGFRWDYFDLFGSTELPGFNKFRSEGAHVTKLRPSFPSLSFPNYYALMTGLYMESHGMVDNYMYDEKHNEVFLIGENPDQYHSFWWDQGEPLWITAKKQGKRSYFWYWCGCEVEIRGYRPDFCQEYLSSPDPSFQNFTDALNTAVEVLRNGSSDIVGVYLERTDALGHKFGQGAAEVKEAIRTIDAQLLRIQNVLETTRFPGQTSGSMFDKVNMGIFSDHGMTDRIGGARDNSSGAIYILDYINRTDFVRAMGSTAGPILSIWPNPGQEDLVYNKLKAANNPNFQVYRKKDIPEKYHIKNNYRIPEIYLVAEKGYAFLRNDTRTLTSVGYHGYENTIEDMHGIFLARGPDFKKGGIIDRIQNIELYGMFCKILGITASPNNGTLENTCGLVSDRQLCTTTSAANTPGKYTTFWVTILASAAAWSLYKY